MALKSLVLLLFLFTLPATLTVPGSCLVVGGVLGSFVIALLTSRGTSFLDAWSSLLMAFLGFGMVCLVRVDPYAVMLFAFIGLGISDWIKSNTELRTSLPDKKNLCFEGVVALSLFWFVLHGVFPATANIWSFRTWYLILAHHSPAIFPVYGQLASLALFCGYLPLFSNSAATRSKFLGGIHAGLWCAVPLVLLQLAGLTFPYVPGEAPFWQYLNRHSGMFEDPNSFGIVIGIALFIGAGRRWYLLSFCWLILAFFSGSRLFTLCLLILLLVLVFHSASYAVTSWKITWSDLLLRGVALLMVFIVSGVMVYFFLNQYNALPIAIHRGLSPLNIVHIRETFSTRTAFWNLGLHIFADNSLAGVGFGNFERVMTSYASRSGNDLNLWTDTPNNFYLGLLSELGMVGFLTFIFESRKFSWNRFEENGIFLQAGAFVFLLMLFFGTHIYFVECALIGAFIVGSCVTERRVEGRALAPLCWIPKGAIFVAIGAMLFMLHRSMEYGWYPWERDIDGSYARWGTPRAQSLQICKDDAVKFEIALPPERTVEIRSPFDSKTFATLPASWQVVTMDCRGAIRLPLHFKVSKGWMPAVDSPDTNDWRTLGVRLKGNPGDMAAPMGIW